MQKRKGPLAIDDKRAKKKESSHLSPIHKKPAKIPGLCFN